MFTWWIFVVQTCKGQKKAYRGMPWLTNPKNLLAFAASQKKTFGFSDQKVHKRSEISNFAQGKLWFCLPDWIFPKYIIYHKWLLKIFFSFAKVIKLIYLETLCLHPKKCRDQSFFTRVFNNVRICAHWCAFQSQVAHWKKFVRFF